MKHKQKEDPLISFIWALVITAITIFAFWAPYPPSEEATVQKEPIKVPHVVEIAEALEDEKEPDMEEVTAKVTGYNTVPAQTDSTPCIAASGDNICGRDDVLACPRHYPLYSKFLIEGKEYTCLDRTALKYNERFDISCDKDFACPYEVHGVKKVYIIR